ncbi:hypothetical protein F8M41_011776 [Gigaspora margarita]|uniref:Uncharacterized protein n=1 Tax=Gigaspora margarita TaxID=4874 RepID=A0A8H4ATT8_GIGMA|nr:hypothetical protein F8M41_011776 [Gigaspora margarita]
MLHRRDEKMLNQNPNERLSAEELCEVFRNWQNDEQILEELNEYVPFESEQFYIVLLKSYFNEEISENISNSDELSEILKKILDNKYSFRAKSFTTYNSTSKCLSGYNAHKYDASLDLQILQ